MTAPQLVIGYDPVIGTGTAVARYTLRVFYDPTITFGTDGRPWALCLPDGNFIGGGLPATELEDLYPNQTELAVFTQRLYEAGVAVISMGYTVTDAAITGQGAFDPATFTRIGTPPESFLTKDESNNEVRTIERDVANAIQVIRRNGLGVGLRTTNNQDGVIGAQAGAVGAMFCALCRSRSDLAAEPGSVFAVPTRLKWAVLVEPIVSFNALANTVAIRHLTNDLGGVAGNIGAAKAAPNAVQNFRDASQLWYGYNTASVRAVNAVTPVYAVGRGPITYTGSFDYATFDGVLTTAFAPEQVQALQSAQLALDTAAGTTFQADNSRFEINPRLLPEDLGVDMFDWFVAVSGFSTGTPSEPPAPNVVDPVLSIGFDPLLGDDTTEERYRMNVFFRQDIAFPQGNRPWLLIADGGGWFPGGNLPIPQLNLTASVPLFAELYALGWAIVSPGYTVANNVGPNFGTFRPDEAFRRIGTGDGSYLVLDPTKAAERNAEKDICNVIQRIRLDGLGVGLDRTPGRNAVWSKSAGSSTVGFAVFGPNRADPDAVPGTRYALDTRVGALVAGQFVGTLNCYTDAFTGLNHFINSAGTSYALTMGEARLGNDAQVFKDQAALWSGFNVETARALNSRMPVFLSATDPQVYFGSLEYEDFFNVIPTAHPVEHVLAMRAALQAAGTEFDSATHTTVSKFYAGETLDPAQQTAEQLAVVLAGNPPLLTEPASERVIRNIETTLAKVKAGIDYWTTLRDVRIIDDAALSAHVLPAALIRATRTDMDGEGKTINGGIRHSMFVSVTLVVESRSSGSRDMELLIRDAVTALYLDRTRGGNAVHTIVEAVDRSYPDGDQQDTFVATLQVRIEFRTEANNLGTSI